MAPRLLLTLEAETVVGSRQTEQGTLVKAHPLRNRPIVQSNALLAPDLAQGVRFLPMKAELQFRPFSGVETIWRQLLEAAPVSTLCHRPSWIELLGRAYGLSFWLA